MLNQLNIWGLTWRPTPISEVIPGLPINPILTVTLNAIRKNQGTLRCRLNLPVHSTQGVMPWGSAQAYTWYSALLTGKAQSCRCSASIQVGNQNVIWSYGYFPKARWYASSPGIRIGLQLGLLSSQDVTFSDPVRLPNGFWPNAPQYSNQALSLFQWLQSQTQVLESILGRAGISI